MSERDFEQLHKLIDKGIRRGVREALLRHKLAGQPIVVWRKGKVVEIAAKDIPVGKKRSKGRKSKE